MTPNVEDADKFANLENRLCTVGIDTNSVDIQAIPITLPILKYGYAKEPFKWDQLSRIILVEKDLAQLSRSETQQREYEIFRHILKSQYKSVVDYILVSKFGFQRRNVDGLWISDPSVENITETRKVLTPNDFPYNMESNVEHYILWKTKEALTPTDIDEAKRELSTRLPVVKTLHWINPPHLKSLPEIDHVHILCLLSEK